MNVGRVWHINNGLDLVGIRFDAIGSNDLPKEFHAGYVEHTLLRIQSNVGIHESLEDSFQSSIVFFLSCAINEDIVDVAFDTVEAF